MLELRDYQIGTLTNLYHYFERATGNPLVVLPTGGGKSLVNAEWIRGVFALDPAARILCLTHVRELVEQNHQELMDLWPDAPAGIYSAGLKRRELSSRILFASIQSIHRKALQVQQCDLVIVDEAHLVPRNTETMYGRFLAELRAINPNMKIIGLTATPFRLDSGLLHEGEGRVFTDIAHETSPRELIDKGYLVPLISKRRHDKEIGTEGVHTRGGEFVAAELEERALDPETISAIADDVVASGQDRRGWLVFGVGIAHCEALKEALLDRGIPTCIITSETPGDERKNMIEAYKRKEIRALVSMGVLTTGFNAKHVDLIALARPTKSTGLYIQMVGRGTRCIGNNITESVANGKSNCLVLDYGGNIRRHGPFDEPFLPHTKAKKIGEEPGDAPMKQCPECENEVLIAMRECPICGFEFPPMESKVTSVADHAPILAPPPAWIDVDDAQYTIHAGRDGKPNTLKATYRCGMTFHHEWICFDHPAGSYPRRAADTWWRKRTLIAGVDTPDSVNGAFVRAGVESELAAPSAIRVRKEGKFTKITDHRIDDERLPYLRAVGPGLRLPQAV